MGEKVGKKDFHLLYKYCRGRKVNSKELGKLVTRLWRYWDPLIEELYELVEEYSFAELLDRGGIQDGKIHVFQLIVNLKRNGGKNGKADRGDNFSDSEAERSV